MIASFALFHINKLAYVSSRFRHNNDRVHPGSWVFSRFNNIFIKQFLDLVRHFVMGMEWCTPKGLDDWFYFGVYIYMKGNLARFQLPHPIEDFWELG